jgi:transcriptional antiterminator RfaH
MESWYVVHTKPRQEKRAERNLQLQGFHCYLPQIQKTRKRRGKRYLAIEALFPRYLFLRLNLFQDNVAPIRSTLGVSGLVHFGWQLPTMPESLIAKLLNATDPTSGLIKIPEHDFVKGERVIIEDGPLAGMEGIFQAATGKERVIILLDILGRQNAVTVPRELIARVGELSFKL